MGQFKNQQIEEMEHSLPLTYDIGEEGHYQGVLSEFTDLINRYGIDTVIKSLSPELKFSILEAIIKSQGRLMKGN